MIVQFVKFESRLTEAEAFSKAKERLAQFKEIPGLLQKYYVKLDQPKSYGGIYVWDSAQSMQAYREFGTRRQHSCRLRGCRSAGGRDL